MGRRHDGIWLRVAKSAVWACAIVCVAVFAARADRPAGLEVMTYSTSDAPTLDAVMAVPEGFEPLPAEGLVTGYGDHVYWLRMPFPADGDLLVLGAMVDEADFFAVTASGEIGSHMLSGDARPATVRPVVSAQVVFPIPRSDRMETIYLRIRQATHIVSPIEVRMAADYWAERARKAQLRALLLGGVTIMILFNSAVLIATRDPAFLLNALTIGSMVVLDLYLTGIAAAYVWPGSGDLSNVALVLSLISACGVGGAFFYLFLIRSEDGASGLVRSLLVLPAGAVLLAAALPLLPYWWVLAGAYVLLAAVLLLLGMATISEALQGNRRAYAMTVPLFFGMLPGASLTVGERVWGIDLGALHGHVLEVTLVVEALLFSLALAYRIRLAERERADAQARLITHLSEAERRLVAAVDGERSRIANDLHETAGQGLVSVTGRLERLGRGDALPEPTKAEIGEVASVSKRLISDIRRISHNLHSAALQQLGFDRALRALADTINAAGEVAVEIDNALPDDRLGEERARHLYPILHELLTNCVKHSDARQCRIALGARAGSADIEWRDDSTGIFDVAAGIAGSGDLSDGIGLGLVGQRVRCLHGRLDGGRTPSGQKLHLRFPLDAVADGPETTRHSRAVRTFAAPEPAR